MSGLSGYNLRPRDYTLRAQHGPASRDIVVDSIHHPFVHSCLPDGHKPYVLDYWYEPSYAQYLQLRQSRGNIITAVDGYWIRRGPNLVELVQKCHLTDCPHCLTATLRGGCMLGFEDGCSIAKCHEGELEDDVDKKDDAAEPALDPRLLRAMGILGEHFNQTVRRSIMQLTQTIAAFTH